MNRSILLTMLVVLSLLATGAAQPPDFPPEGEPSPAWITDGTDYLQDDDCDSAAPGPNPWATAKVPVCAAQEPDVPQQGDAFTAQISVTGSHPVDAGVLLVPGEEVEVRVAPFVDAGAGFALDPSGTYALRFFYTDSAGGSQRVPAYGDNQNPAFLSNAPGEDGSYVFTFPSAKLQVQPAPVGGFLVQVIKIENGATATFSSLFAPKEALLGAAGAAAAPVADIMDSHGTVGDQEAHAWTPLFVAGAPDAGDGFTARLQIEGAILEAAALLVPHGDLTFTGTPFIADADGVFDSPPDGDEYALRLYYTTPDAPGEIHMIPSSDDESNPIFIQPVQSGTVSFTVPAHMIPVDGGINGFKAELIRFDDDRDAIQWSNLFAPKDALLEAGAAAAPVADLLDANLEGPDGEDLTPFTPFFVAGVPQPLDGFTTGMRFEGAVATQGPIIVPDGDQFEVLVIAFHEHHATPETDWSVYAEQRLQLHVVARAGQDTWWDEQNNGASFPLQHTGGGRYTATVSVADLPTGDSSLGYQFYVSDLDHDDDGGALSQTHYSSFHSVAKAHLFSGCYQAPDAPECVQRAAVADVMEAKEPDSEGRFFTPVFIQTVSDGMFSRIIPQNAAVEGANMVISPDSRGNYVFQVEAFQSGELLDFSQWRVEVIGIGGTPVLYEQGSYGAGAAAAANHGDHVHTIRIASSQLRLPEGPSNVVALRFYIGDGAELSSGYSQVANELFDTDAAAAELAEVAFTPILLNPPSTPSPPAIPPSGGA